MKRYLFAAALGTAVLQGCPAFEFTPDPDPNARVRVVDALYYYPTGNQPFAVAVADMNGDGLLDLVTANGDGNSVSVLLGKTGGGFEAQQEFPAGEAPLSVAVADFDGDGRPDIATANSASNTVHILLAEEEGYSPPARYELPAGASPAHMAALDVNGNGYTDLAIAAQGLNALVFFLGNGDGTFDTRAEPIAVGAGPRFVIPLYHAGFLTALLTVNRDSNDLALLQAMEEGGYAPPIFLPVGINPRAAALINLNDDDYPDLVVSNPGSEDLSVLMGQGDGLFAPEHRIPVRGAPTRLATGDFNGNGTGDVAVVLFDPRTGSPRSEIAVLLGDGEGDLGAARYFGGRRGTIDVVAAPITASTGIDLITASNTSSDVAVLPGRGDGTFATDERFHVGERPRVIVAADFNEDGAQDLAVLNQGTADISILINRGDGTFEPEATLAFTGTPRAMDAADFNNNSHADLVVTDLIGGAVSVYLGRGDGTFHAQRRFLAGGGGSDARSVATYDMDGDGNTDIVVGNAGRDSISILLGDGTGSFGPAREFDARNFPLAVKATDLNGDGQGDVVFLNGLDPNDPASGQNPRVRPLLGIGGGALEEAATHGPYRVDANPVDLALFDLDGDGDLDGVTAHPNRNFLNLVASSGGGRFLAGEILRTGNAPNSVALGMLNSDRFPDIVATCEQHTVSVLLGRNGLNFDIFILYPVGTSPIGGIIAELNGDRSAEIVVANREGATISVLRGRP